MLGQTHGDKIVLVFAGRVHFKYIGPFVKYICDTYKILQYIFYRELV